METTQRKRGAIQRWKRVRFFRAPILLAVVCVVASMALLPASAGPAGARAAKTTIAGVVRDPAGEPISRAFVQLDEDSTTSVPFPWTAADPEGRFELKNVPTGKVRIRAIAGESRIWSGAGKVVESLGGARGLVIILDPGRELRVKVEDYAQYDHGGLGPRPGAKLVWQQPRNASHEFRWAPIAGDGSVRFVQLPDEPSFEVWGSASLDRPFKKSGLKPGKHVHVIRTVPGLKISGKFLPARITVETTVRLQAHAYPYFWVGNARVKSDGTFVVRGLPEGEYSLTCSLKSQKHGPDWVTKTVRAGATGVEFDLRRHAR